MSTPMIFYKYKQSPWTQLMILFAPYLLYVIYCIIIICIKQLYVNTCLCIRQYICCTLDALYIIHLYLMLLEIFRKYHTNFFYIFSVFHFPALPWLWLKPPAKLVKPLGNFDFSNFIICFQKNRFTAKSGRRLTSQTGTRANLVGFWFDQIQKSNFKQKTNRFYWFCETEQTGGHR
jgi:hypothetical protein